MSLQSERSSHILLLGLFLALFLDVALFKSPFSSSAVSIYSLAETEVDHQ